MPYCTSCIAGDIRLKQLPTFLVKVTHSSPIADVYVVLYVESKYLTLMWLSNFLAIVFVHFVF